MRSIKYIFSVLCMVMTIPTALRAQGSGWTVNPYDFPYDMTVYAGLVMEEGMVTDYANYEIAAFVGDECRGVAEVQTQGGKTWLYMRVRSNTTSGETVAFKLYDRAESREYDVSESVTFESQARVGRPSAPMELHLIYSVSAKSANEDMGRVEMDGVGQVVGGSSQRVVAIPETGYVFVRWSQDGVPVSTENPYMFTVFKDASLVASFKLGRYNVTFDVDGVTSTESMLYGTVIPSPDEPSKEGHTFAGWLPKFEEGATVPANDITYVAQWTVNQYTITFDTDGGSAVAPITQDYGTAITAPAAPSKEGYTFKGWSEQIPATMPAANKTIKALWTVNQYTITFDTDGGSAVAPITQDYGTAITAPAAPTKEGHTFKGWSEQIPATMPAANKTIKALWTVNQYTITFDTDGGSAVAPITQDYGTAITAPAAPSKEGYTFKGWSEQIPATMPAANKTIKALWTVNQYTITFDTDGGSAVAPITQDYGTAITAPVPPSKEGHTFNGWSEQIPATMPAGDKTIKALWTVNQYTITFDTDGGSAVAPITQDYGTAITAPAAPSKEGYTFKGWSEQIPATMPAANKTIKALWNVNKYEVLFKVDGAEYSKAIVEYGSEITLPANPTKEGHTFVGWGDVPKAMPSKDIVLNATFSINKYLVTFVVDGEVLFSGSLQYGSRIETPEVPAKEGHTFDGWKDVDETVPAHDVTYESSYTVNIYKVLYYIGDKLVHTDEVAFGDEIPEYEYKPAGNAEVFKGWIGDKYDTMPAHDVTYVADIATSISSLLENNGKVVIYDLRGRRINDASTLRSGVYIINGKKTVVR